MTKLVAILINIVVFVLMAAASLLFMATFGVAAFVAWLVAALLFS